MISAKVAKKQAAKFAVPTPGSGEFIKVPSIEVMHYFLQINGLEVVGWRGDYLQVRKIRVVEFAESEVELKS